MNLAGGGDFGLRRVLAGAALRATAGVIDPVISGAAARTAIGSLPPAACAVAAGATAGSAPTATVVAGLQSVGNSASSLDSIRFAGGNSRMVWRSASALALPV